MKKNFLFLAALLVLSRPAAAMFCPNGFNQINIGDTLEEVQQQCGKPDAKTEEKSAADVPQQWQYYVKSDPTNPASLNVTIAFVNGKASNITVNGTSLASTSICGSSVSVGNTTDQVKSACGSPSMVTKSQSDSSAPATVITRLKYNTTPPVTLVFENNKLTKRE